MYNIVFLILVLQPRFARQYCSSHSSNFRLFMRQTLLLISLPVLLLACSQPRLARESTPGIVNVYKTPPALIGSLREQSHPLPAPTRGPPPTQPPVFTRGPRPSRYPVCTLLYHAEVLGPTCGLGTAIRVPRVAEIDVDRYVNLLPFFQQMYRTDIIYASCLMQTDATISPALEHGCHFRERHIVSPASASPRFQFWCIHTFSAMVSKKRGFCINFTGGERGGERDSPRPLSTLFSPHFAESLPCTPLRVLIMSILLSYKYIQKRKTHELGLPEPSSSPKKFST